MLRNLVDGADIGMVQGRRSSSFTSKSFERLRVMIHIFGQEFQGDEATKLGVFSLVNHTHPAAAQLLQDAVVRDGLDDHEGYCSVLSAR
jgi:hypothetical protein